jgi:glycosyltransferase involved in cell wall biosynthesis
MVTFVAGLGHRAIAFGRLRRAVTRHHAADPYDVVYQFSNIETFGVPFGLARSVPLVIHPETHMAGELRWLLAERRLGRRCEPWYRSLLVGSVFALRTVVQRVTIHQASLLICISGVFRDHLITDYRFPRSATVVVPNPVNIERFGEIKSGIGQPPTAVVIGRIAMRKGVEQIVALSHLLRERHVNVRLRIVGAHSQWSDYRPLLEDLEPTNTTYVGQLGPAEIPVELGRNDILIQASKYEPFGLTVAEALAAGTPVIATTEVGAIEGVSSSSVVATPVSDPEALADAAETMLERLRADGDGVRRTARADAQRLFSVDVVCQRISEVLEDLAASRRDGGL